jgi:iron complex outermembrane recepter protein
MRKTSTAIACLTLLLQSRSMLGQNSPSPNLADQTLEQLMSIQVTSVGKKAQSLQTAAASAYVITSEDIRRSGIHTLPDLLRMAPGVQVAQVASGTWAVSIRGFADQYSNKLLVLVDGRSVYNDAYGGVFWDMLETSIDDIDRIEVIRGPAAAIWGPNAVNGVINILTKAAKDTQGGLVTAVAGSETEAGASVRYGDSLGKNAQYRVTGSSQTHGPLVSDGFDPVTGWTRHSLGFRMDWSPHAADSVSISGQGMESALGNLSLPITPANPFPTPAAVMERSFEGNIMSSWRHVYSNGSSLEMHGSWEHVNRGDFSAGLHYDISEGELKYHFAWGSRQDLMAGVDFRGSDYQTDPGAVAQVPHTEFRDESVFFQDEIKLVRDKLSFIAGAYLGRYSFAGFQVQPTARLMWTPTKKVAVWAAISRAVRTPSLIDLNINTNYQAVPVGPLVGIVRLTGNPQYQPEPTVSYETGQRVEAGRRVSLDFSEFFTVYHRLDSQDALAPSLVFPGPASPPYLDIPYSFQNGRFGRSYGGEASVTWAVLPRWTLTGGYSWLHLSTTLYSPASMGANTLGQAGSPGNQWEGRSHMGLTRHLDWDAALYYSGRMLSPGLQMLPMPTGFRGDTHLTWRAGEHAEFSTGVENAFSPNQPQFYSLRLMRLTEVHRNVFGAARWTF